MAVVLEKPCTGQASTAEELLHFPLDWHFELVQGVLREMSMPTGDAHGSHTALLTLYLMSHIVENDLGEGFAAETGFLLSQNPDTVKAPDFGFVSYARLQGIPRGTGYIAAVPNVVLETRSPSDRAGMIAAKIREWLDAGVQMVLDLDPSRQQLTVYCPGHDPVILTPADTLEGGNILPGLTLPLHRVFR